MIWRVFFDSKAAAARALSLLRGEARAFYWNGADLSVFFEKERVASLRRVLEEEGIIEEEDT